LSYKYNICINLKRLEELVKRATQRERIPVQIKTIVIFLYFDGKSLRAISLFLQHLGYKASREAIRKWIHSIFKFLPESYQSSDIAFIDETKIKKR